MTFKHIADYTFIQRAAGFGRKLWVRQIVFCFQRQKMALLLRAKYRTGDNLLATLLQCIFMRSGHLLFLFMPKVMRHCKKFRDVHFDPDAFATTDAFI
ncbi:hypothetical protein HMPREF1594_01256 [Escherichia coli 907446]|nr:hypothetical protein HMPREF1594_01256 [Escherichia coli 907446]